jgi:hypothetical protein
MKTLTVDDETCDSAVACLRMPSLSEGNGLRASARVGDRPKERYFLRCDGLNSTLGTAPSGNAQHSGPEFSTNSGSVTIRQEGQSRSATGR